MDQDRQAKWHIDVDGQKFGPFTIAQITGLLNQKEITAESKITADYLGDQWVTVAEVLRQHARPSAIPPRPDEALLAPLHPHPAHQQKKDSLDGLFDVIQSIRERKPAKKSLSPTTAPLEATVAFTIPAGARIWAPIGVASIVVVLGLYALVSSHSAVEVSHPEPSAKMETVAEKPDLPAESTVASTPVQPTPMRRMRPLAHNPFVTRQTIAARAQAQEHDNRDRDQDVDQEQARDQDRDQRDQDQARDQARDQDQDRDSDRADRSVAGSLNEGSTQAQGRTDGSAGGDSGTVDSQQSAGDDGQSQSQFQSNP